MGASPFLTRTLQHMSNEMSRHVLACNLNRVMRIVSMGAMLTALATQGP